MNGKLVNAAKEIFRIEKLGLVEVYGVKLYIAQIDAELLKIMRIG